MGKSGGGDGGQVGRFLGRGGRLKPVQIMTK